MSDHKKSKKRKSDAISTSETAESHQNGSDDGQKLKKIKLEYVETSDKDCGPFIASFPHGPPPPYVLSNDPTDGLQWVCLKRESKEAPIQWHKQLAAETKKVIYSGSNFGADSQKTDLSKYMVGVFDKKTKTLKLVESPHIFKMDQHIKGLETKVTVDNMYKNLSYLEKRKILVDAFGTKRTRTTIRQLMSNKIDPTSAMDVDQVAADLIADKIKKDDENRAEGDDNTATPVVENIPPYDPEATKPAKIYDINNIIAMDEMNFLTNNKSFVTEALKKRSTVPASPVKEEGDNRKKSNEHEDNWYSSFVVNRLKELEKLDSADKNTKARKERSIAALQYLNYLLRFHKFMGNFLPREVPPAKMKMLPGVLYSRMVEKFAQIKSVEKMNYEKTKPLRLKLINYACVLALIACGFETDVHLIADDIGMTQKQMKLHFQQVGCDLIYKKSKRAKKANEKDDEDDDEEEAVAATSSASLYVAKLKAPYKPPAPKRMGPPKKF